MNQPSNKIILEQKTKLEEKTKLEQKTKLEEKPKLERFSMARFSKNQIFREEVPKSLLFNLLQNICLKTDKYYFIDYNSYKKFLYEEELHKTFLDTLRPLYHESKRVYLDRKMTYNSFINIVRQICKFNHIPFTSKIHYNKSSYNIDYYIYEEPCGFLNCPW